MKTLTGYAASSELIPHKDSLPSWRFVNGDADRTSNITQIRFFAPDKTASTCSTSSSCGGSFSKLVALQRTPLLPIAVLPPSDSQVELESAETQVVLDEDELTVHVKLQLQKECEFGEQFLVIGNDPVLGSWNPLHAIPMDWSDGHVWTAELDVPTGKPIEFKFILRGNNGKTLWQPGPDRTLPTWETNNTISIFEDWDEAQCQRVTEEETVTDNLSQPSSLDLSEESEVKARTIHESDSSGEESDSEEEIVEKATSPVGEGLAGSPIIIPEEIVEEDTENIGVKEELKAYEEVPILVPGLSHCLDIPTKEVIASNGGFDASANVSDALPELDDHQQERKGKGCLQEQEEIESLSSNEHQRNEYLTGTMTNDGQEVYMQLDDQLLEDKEKEHQQNRDSAWAMTDELQEVCTESDDQELKETEKEHQLAEGAAIKLIFSDKCVENRDPAGVAIQKLPVDEAAKRDPQSNKDEDGSNINSVDNSILWKDVKWGEKTLKKLLNYLGVL